MDNASKALIMAGAVLISIALVGVGVYIFSSTNTMIGGANKQLDDAAAQMTNSTLGQYAGSNVRGSTVKQLLEKVRISNLNDSLPVDVTVTLNGNKIEDANLSTANITDTKYYTVEITDSNSDGYYDTVAIK
jgi:hypothetical protein